MQLDKCAGRSVEMIYMDGDSQFTQRKVRIQSVRDDQVRAYCYERQAYRTFRTDGILAVMLVGL